MLSRPRIIAAIIVIGLALIIYYTASFGPAEEDYATSILAARLKKDVFMRSSGESPFGGDRASFTKLKYFEPDARYKITAALEPIANKKIVTLPTSDNQAASYLEYAWAVFDLDGIENKLLLLETREGPSRGTLFLAFADATSAVETYGAGRYVELKKVAGASTIVLDFNNAYNPYCAYSNNFSCPFPPPENILNVAIKAGEKNYH